MDGASDPLSYRRVIVPDFVANSVRCSVSGPIAQNKQVVLVLPVANFDVGRDDTVYHTRDIEWWSPNTPIFSKLVTRCKTPTVVPRG